MYKSFANILSYQQSIETFLSTNLNENHRYMHYCIFLEIIWEKTTSRWTIDEQAGAWL